MPIVRARHVFPALKDDEVYPHELVVPIGGLEENHTGRTVGDSRG